VSRSMPRFSPLPHARRSPCGCDVVYSRSTEERSAPDTR
jgi:hypothetical protein